MEQAKKLKSYLPASSTENVESLTRWNDEIEDVLFGPMDAQLEDLPTTSFDAADIDALTAISQALRKDLIESILSLSEPDDDSIQCILASSDTAIFLQERVALLLRTLRNWLRWYLQVSPLLAQSNPSQPSFIRVFQQQSMLDLWLHILEQLAPSAPLPARHVAQIFFYSTFDTNEDTQEYLVSQLDEKRFLRILLTTNSWGVGAAVQQCIHQWVATAQSAGRRVKEARLPSLADRHAQCPWLPKNTTEVSYMDVWDRVLAVCFLEGDGPPLSGEYRAEMVGEILRSLYALTLWTTVTRQIVPVLLNLPRKNDGIVQCQQALMALLTEGDASLTPSLMECLPTLLHLWEDQLTQVVTAQRVDEAAAATLTPYFVTLYRYCVMDEAFCEAIRHAVFPNELPADMSTSQPMHPIDAPQGTLRAKVIKLLTWPQSHIKRLAGELVWRLCHNHPTEFARRVGMGNALPFLAAKGHAQLPPSVFK